MIVLDASVMIAIMDDRDGHFATARALFRDVAEQRLTAHRITISETLVGAVRARRGPQMAAALARLGVGQLDELDDPLALAELRVSTGLRMPDCCVLLAARRDTATLATFDQRLADTARSFGVPVLPAIG